MVFLKVFARLNILLLVNELVHLCNYALFVINAFFLNSIYFQLIDQNNKSI